MEPELHLFICTNSTPKGSCCEDKALVQLRIKLKELVTAQYGKRVRINSAGCLGQCTKGGVAVLYPEGKWFYGLNQNSAPMLLSELEDRLRCL